MFTSPIRMRPGSGESTKIPTACCASTYPKEPISPCSHKTNSMTSPGGSIPDQEKLWDGKRPLNCSCQKALSTSSSTGQLKSFLLHLELESAHPLLLKGPGFKNTLGAPPATHASNPLSFDGPARAWIAGPDLCKVLAPWSARV